MKTNALWIVPWIEPGGPSLRVITHIRKGNKRRTTRKSDWYFVTVQYDVFS